MDRQNLPFVSVIIPTYNRGRSLVTTLKSLLKQEYPCFEIIVVDQSDQRYFEKDNFLKKYKEKICVIRSSYPNLPRARNQGINKAKGEIIIFYDDDVFIGKECVAAHVKNYSDITVGGVTGRVITPGQKIEKKFRKVGKVSPAGVVAGGYSSEIYQGVSNVIGCNMSSRKSFLQKLGGFDENFRGNALREETDLALRMKQKGWRLIFEPKAEIIHLRSKTGGCRMDNRKQWFMDYFHNETYFFLKWISWYWWLFFWLSRWQWFIRSKSLILPCQGIYQGIITYRKLKDENRH